MRGAHQRAALRADPLVRSGLRCRAGRPAIGPEALGSSPVPIVAVPPVIPGAAIVGIGRTNDPAVSIADIRRSIIVVAIVSRAVPAIISGSIAAIISGGIAAVIARAIAAT